MKTTKDRGKGGNERKTRTTKVRRKPKEKQLEKKTEKTRKTPMASDLPDPLPIK